MCVFIYLDREWRWWFENSSHSWCWAQAQWRDPVRCIQFIESSTDTAFVLHRFGRLTATRSVGKCWYWSGFGILFRQFNKRARCGRFESDHTTSIQTDRRCASLFDTRTRRLYGFNWRHSLLDCHIWWISKTFNQLVTSRKYSFNLTFTHKHTHARTHALVLYKIHSKIIFPTSIDWLIFM